jgi:NADPH:quinone reductase
MGMYPSPVGLPFVAGNEGAGEVTAVGPGVTDFKVGDHVGYVTALGCYAAERVVGADRAVKVPDGIGHEQVAGMMLKGMTVEYLVRRTFKVEKGQNVFVHAAAGGVGLILCQWANHLGANVIGTVGSKDKAELAKANGCHHTILYRDEDFVARTNILQQKGSLFATRPTLNTYAAKRADLLDIADHLFAVVKSGAVKIPINQKYPLRDAAKAHRDLESRGTTGSSILIP